MSEVHALISDALQAGIPIDEIVSDFAQNGSDEEKDWAHRWISTANKPSYAPGAGVSPERDDGLLGKINSHLQDTSTTQLLAEGAGIVAAGKGLQLAGRAGNQIVDRWIQNKFPTTSEKAYAEQVAKQGITAPGQLEGGVQLSPLEQERIKTEQLRQTKLHSEISQRENQIAAQEAKAKLQSVAAGSTNPTVEAGLPSTTQQFSVQQKPTDYSLNPEAAYGQQSYNKPTGVPNVAAVNAAPPPAGTEIKPVDPLVQAKLNKIAAQEARDAERHANEERRKQEKHEKDMQSGGKKPTKTETPAVDLEKITSPTEIPSTEQVAKQAAEQSGYTKGQYEGQLTDKDLTPIGNNANVKVTEEVKDAIKPTVDKIEKTTAVVPWSRDENGNIKYPEGMSNAAKSGHQAFKQLFPEVDAQLEREGKFAILNGGAGDNSLHNTYNTNLAKTLRNELLQGEMVGSNLNYEEKVRPAIAAVPPESALGKQLSVLRETEPKGGNKGVLGKPVAMKEGKMIIGKNEVPGLIKKGAAAALVMGIGNAANAKELATNIGEGLLPIGLTPSPLASGMLPEREQKIANENFILSQPGNKAELESLIKGKSAKEANKIREEYLKSAPTTDYDRMVRLFEQQAAAKRKRQS